MSLDTLFGELRSLLANGSLDPSETQHFLDLIDQAIALDEEKYRAQWIPYMEQARIAWPVPFHVLDRKNLEVAWLDHVPFVRVEIDLSHVRLPLGQADAFTSAFDKLEGKAPRSSAMTLDAQGRAPSRPWGLPLDRAHSLVIDSSVTTLEALTYLMKSPGLEAVRELRFDGYNGNGRRRYFKLDPSFIEPLTHSPYTTNVEFLSVGGNHLEASDFESLAASPLYGQVKRVVANSNNPGRDGLIALLGGERGQQLESINLTMTRLDENAMSALAHGAPLRRLNRLHLGWNRIGVRGATILANSPRLEAMQELGLGRCAIEDEGLEALFTSETLPAPKWLDISGNSCGTESLIRLVQSAWAANLEYIDSSNNALTAEVISALANAPFTSALEGVNLAHETTVSNQRWARPGTPRKYVSDEVATLALLQRLDPARVTSLDLSGSKVSLDGARIIANMKNLTSLSLDGCGLDDAMLLALVNAPDLTRLKRLSVRFNDLSDQAGAAMAHSVNMSGVSVLGIAGNAMGDLTIAAICDEGPMPALSSLDMSNNNIGEAGAKALLSSHSISRLSNISMLGNPMVEQYGHAVEGIRGVSITCHMRIG